MTKDPFTKILLSILAVMLFINFLYSAIETRSSDDVKANDIARFQLSSLPCSHHIGDNSIETTTGRATDSTEARNAEH